MRSIQHAPVVEVLMIFCFMGLYRSVEMQDFGLLSDMRFGQLCCSSFDGKASTIHKEFHCFVSSDILFVLLAFR
jgi:hypothetical protein